MFLDKQKLLDWLDKEEDLGGNNEVDNACRWQIGEVIRRIESGEFDVNKAEGPQSNLVGH